MAFTHTLIAPAVSDMHPRQRWFRGLADQHAVMVSGGEATVYRDARSDVAEVRLSSCGGRAIFSAQLDLGPDALRDLAQRLLDAAHDIEANPSAALSKAQFVEA